MTSKMKVALVHQGIWDMEKLSMPLALGYLKAYAQKDEAIKNAVDFRIFNYRGADQPIHMVPEVLIAEPPDILACSVFGWNFRNFGQLATTFRQIKPEGWTIFGGTHVAMQAERVFRLYPEVDVVVNGEGEISFANLLRAFLAGRSRHDLADIRGISFRSAQGDIVTTEAEPRIKDLDIIPSPFLTGAIPLFDDNGEFLYDAVTMETNRGCPYSCAFCYWGGAIGQKMNAFSRERLREELELFGRMRVQNICLCDSNFGMLPADQTFLEDFIVTRSQCRFPHVLTMSWAKNKGKLFYEIVRTMRQAGLSADFTLAIQTLDPDALRSSRRHNMAINKFEDLCEWLHKEGLGAYAEMIWGLPGETYDSFLRGYDRIARFVPRIATYSNLLLPNTAYDRERAEHKFITIRGQDYDFEYILTHATMTLDDNRRMHAFMFWARIIAEFMFLRHVWIPLRERCGLSQSNVLLDLNAWIETQAGDPAAAALLRCRDDVVSNLDASRTGRPIRVLYQHTGVSALLERWWNESILPNAQSELRPFLRELFRYETIMRPLHEDRARAEGLEMETIDETRYFVRRGVTFEYDVAGAISPGADTTSLPLPSRQPPIDYLYQVGFSQHIDNHEILVHYRAKTREEIHTESLLRNREFVPQDKDRHIAGLADTSMRRHLDVVS
jgi:radical SAM C-methyltransferase